MNDIAERQVIALALTGAEEVRAGFLAIPPEAFHRGLHGTVAAVIRDRIVRGIPIDPLGIAGQAASIAGTDHKAQLVHQFVAECVTTAPPLPSFAFYGDELLRSLHLRRVQEAGQRLCQLAEAGRDGAELADVVASMRSTVDDLETGFGLIGDPDKPISLAALMAQPEEPHDWLVPGLLERTDRLLITGFEGLGKSHLVAQLGITLGAGVHPFSGKVMEDKGLRVLVVDAENSRRQIRRRWGGIRARVDGLRAAVEAEPVDWGEQLRLVIRPEGLDLADVGEFARLEQAIALTAPDVVIGGPLYKLTRADVRDEVAARALIDALDRLRVRYGFALVLEAHAGHVGEAQGSRRLRPTGSSLFLRWPEFGLGIRAHAQAAEEEHPSLVHVLSWRGGRDVRDWPALLGHSAVELPWTPRDPAYRKRNGMGEFQRERTWAVGPR